MAEATSTINRLTTSVRTDSVGCSKTREPGALHQRPEFLAELFSTSLGSLCVAHTPPFVRRCFVTDCASTARVTAECGPRDDNVVYTDDSFDARKCTICGETFGVKKALVIGGSGGVNGAAGANPPEEFVLLNAVYKPRSRDEIVHQRCFDAIEAQERERELERRKVHLDALVHKQRLTLQHLQKDRTRANCATTPSSKKRTKTRPSAYIMHGPT